MARAIVLVLAGIGGGLTGSIAGLASIVTYPVLLAAGLPPITANVTNTVALVCSSVGSVHGSRPELRGQGERIRRLAIAGVVGGAAGGALLLVTPAGSFARVVPWLIALAAIAMLFRRRLVDEVVDPDQHQIGPGLMAAVAAVGIYGGYFGAGAGVMLLALLLHTMRDTMPRANAAKNVVLGCANAVAAVAFVFFGDVRWASAAPLGVGLLIGGRIGPIVVRRAPVGPLRTVIAVAGLGLALKLAIDAYR
ncbi:MAG: hypothetical protein JWM12_4054 [Ilumatobacteraceae bacterium]|nr:hypothetical protein [Ilumatobacteraceae bacterium]